MYILIALSTSAAWSGELARAAFASMEEAEARMTRWARFGVDSYCTEADSLHIFDATGAEVRRWSWRERKPVPVEVASGDA